MADTRTLDQQIADMLSYFVHCAADSCPQHIPDQAWNRQMKRARKLLKDAGLMK